MTFKLFRLGFYKCQNQKPKQKVVKLSSGSKQSDVSSFLKRMVCGQPCPELLGDTWIPGVSNIWTVSALS